MARSSGAIDPVLIDLWFLLKSENILAGFIIMEKISPLFLSFFFLRKCLFPELCGSMVASSGILPILWFPHSENCARELFSTIQVAGSVLATCRKKTIRLSQPIETAIM